MDSACNIHDATTVPTIMQPLGISQNEKNRRKSEFHPNERTRNQGIFILTNYHARFQSSRKRGQKQNIYQDPCQVGRINAWQMQQKYTFRDGSMLLQGCHGQIKSVAATCSLKPCLLQRNILLMIFRYLHITRGNWQPLFFFKWMWSLSCFTLFSFLHFCRSGAWCFTGNNLSSSRLMLFQPWFFSYHCFVRP